MKTSEFGLTLEGAHECRYAKKGAHLIGQHETARLIGQISQAKYTRLLEEMRDGVSKEEVRDALWQAYAVQQPPMMMAAETLRTDIAAARAQEVLSRTPIDIEGAHVPIIIDGLEAITDLSRVAAIRHMVLRPVAEAMLAELGVARPHN